MAPPLGDPMHTAPQALPSSLPLVLQFPSHRSNNGSPKRGFSSQHRRRGSVGIPSHSLMIAPSRRCRGVASYTNWTAPLRLTIPGRFRVDDDDDDAGLSCKAQQQEEEAQAEAADEAAMVSEDAQDILLQGWPKVALYLFALGLLLGPPLDGIHSRVQLQIYDRGAVDIAGLHTNIWVFPMLGLFYSVVGVLQLVLDKYLAPKDNFPTTDLKKVVLSFITLVTLIEVSAELYKAGVPFNIEAYILFFLAEANWLVFENTWWGFGLATLVGTACPLIEIPITKMFGLWHYPRGNVELFGESTVTWVLACYFFYTPFISNLARYLSSVTRTSSPQKRLD